MKKLNKLLFLSFILLAGCSNNTSSDVNSTTTSSSSSSSIISSSSENKYDDVYYDGYYKATKQAISYADVRRSSHTEHDLPSTGNQKILVVPVKFKDSKLADTAFGGSDLVKSHIEKTFFGEAQDTGWESVTSYYKKSSYGKLNISGKVSDWCTLDITYAESEALNGNGINAHSTAQIARMVGKWYIQNYDDASDYDQNDDGYIDLLWMVYDWESNNDGENDWAHVYWDFMNTSFGSVDDPIPYTFAWAGIKFLYEGGYTDENGDVLVDAHTFIHETGHALGLDDYYDYSKNYSYSGGLDMMDVNIGDHTGLSKYLLGWTNPYVVTDNCEITINSFTETGDFIIIKDEWNHSATDEYLLIEFHTPTGLNYKDSTENYAVKYPIHFQKPGIKVYHVDARLGHYVNNRFQRYVDDVYGLDDGYLNATQLAHSNTLSRSCNGDFELYHLFENVRNPKLHTGSKYATDESLFHKGDTFDPYDYELCLNDPEMFNDGEYIDFIFEVVEMTDTSATLNFTRISSII